jgi:hypothetical protein
MEIIRMMNRAFPQAPNAVAAVAIAFILYLIAIKIIEYLKTKPTNDAEFVKRVDCHSHIDRFREEMNNNFAIVRDDVRTLQQILVNHIDK